LSPKLKLFVYTRVTYKELGFCALNHDLILVTNNTKHLKRWKVLKLFSGSRKRNMASRIEDLLRRKETSFVIVRADHLIGD
jgi:hypothetical protein